jgi:hypothetical protein
VEEKAESGSYKRMIGGIVSERKCKNWLQTLNAYVEETESPRHFWLWGGIFTLASALQRKVWLPFGLEPLYPNLYVMLVAPPGKCRKGSPLGLAKKLLTAAEVSVSVDSLSKRALTKEMANLAKESVFRMPDGKAKSHCSLAIVSKELSSLLAVDPKGMIEVLTDLYDSHDQWKYSTSGEGHDYLYGVCINCFLGSTPNWISRNLPEEAIGGGLWSRMATIVGYDRHKRITLPPLPPEGLYEDLLEDLVRVSNLVGEFEWEDGGDSWPPEGEAYAVFDEWYQGLDSKYMEVKDDRIHSFLERIHIMVLKVAMVLRVSYSDSLVITPGDIRGAITTLETVLASASDALGGHGRSRTATDVEKVIQQVKMLKKVTSKELLQMNYRNTNKTELDEVLATVVGMGLIEAETYNKDNSVTYKWIGKGKRKKE